MDFPLEANILDDPIDFHYFFQKALDEVTLSNKQIEITRLLEKGRDLKTLAAIQEILPDHKPGAFHSQALRKRGRWRTSRLMRSVSRFLPMGPVNVLEIGCGRGEVLSVLSENPDLFLCGLDIDDRLFLENRKTLESLHRVLMVQSPAEKMPFSDGIFDLVIGYNSMEHFDNPITVMNECLRITKPGGVMYFWFGPQFNGPYGPHLQTRIALPYFHHFFPREVVAEFLNRTGEDPYQGKNEWSTRRFHELFIGDSRYSCRLYREEYIWEHLWLVKQFPSEFKKFHPSELVIRAIEVACQLKGSQQTMSRKHPGGSGTMSPAIDLSSAIVSTQDERKVQGFHRAIVPDSDSCKFGIMLDNPDAPHKGDYTSYRLRVPVEEGTTWQMSLRLHNRYQNSKCRGRIVWTLSINGRMLYQEDISDSNRPREFSLPVQSVEGSILVEIRLEAMKNCEPWKWGEASKLFVDAFALETLDRSV